MKRTQTIVINGDPFEVEEEISNAEIGEVTTRRIRRRSWWKRLWFGIKALWGSK